MTTVATVPQRLRLLSKLLPVPHHRSYNDGGSGGDDGSDVVPATTSASASADSFASSIETKYILCFGMLEIVSERHMVDPAWPLVVRLIRQAAATKVFGDSKKREYHERFVPTLILTTE